MKKMKINDRKNIRMIGIDLDGTLLTGNKELTDFSRGVLVECIRAGILVVPVTGRPLTGVPREVLRIPGIRYCITSNGANTYDLDSVKDQFDERAGKNQKDGPFPVLTGQALLRRAHLSHEVVREILKAAPGKDVIREIFVRGVGYHDQETQQMLEERFCIKPPILAYINRSRRIVADFEGLLTDPASHVENISLMFPSIKERNEVLGRLVRIRGSEGGRILNVLLPWKTDLEVTHVLADKWRALQDLGNRLGISDKDIMTLGDGDNDRPMLRGAGLSVAMGNAPDIVKTEADMVAQDNDHDGAALAIRNAVLCAGRQEGRE